MTYSKRIAVTAAGGHLGTAIIKSLGSIAGSDEAADVVAVARNPEAVELEGVEVRSGDYADVAQMTEAFVGIDTVVLVSAPAGAGDRVQLHRNVIEAAITAGVRKVIYTSVIGNGDEMDTLYAPMAEVNRQAEQDLQDSGLTWIAARNGLYLEFDVAHILNAGPDGIFRNNGGEGYCCYITRTEIALATAVLAVRDHCDNRIVNIVGEAYRQDELIDIVNTQAGTSVSYEAVDDDSVLQKISADRGDEVGRMLTGCYQAIRAGAFDVESDYEQILGMPCKPMQLMAAEVIAQCRAGNAER